MKTVFPSLCLCMLEWVFYFTDAGWKEIQARHVNTVGRDCHISKLAPY